MWLGLRLATVERGCGSPVGSSNQPQKRAEAEPLRSTTCSLISRPSMDARTTRSPLRGTLCFNAMSIRYGVPGGAVKHPAPVVTRYARGWCAHGDALRGKLPCASRRLVRAPRGACVSTQGGTILWQLAGREEVGVPRAPLPPVHYRDIKLAAARHGGRARLLPPWQGHAAKTARSGSQLGGGAPCWRGGSAADSWANASIVYDTRILDSTTPF